VGQLVLRTVRRIAGSLLPVLSIGLLVISFVIDDWYSVNHVEGEKSEGSIYTEYRIEYGLYRFEYLEIWSAILGEGYREEEYSISGEMEDMGDYTITSMALLAVTLLLLIILGLMTVPDWIGNGAPTVLCLVFIFGIGIWGIYYWMNVDDAVMHHIEDGFRPANIELDEEGENEMMKSGEIGQSFQFMIYSVIPVIISFLLFIDPRRDRDPTIREIEKGFFR
jgi:hypothetical protein